MDKEELQKIINAQAKNIQEEYELRIEYYNELEKNNKKMHELLIIINDRDQKIKKLESMNEAYTCELKMHKLGGSSAPIFCGGNDHVTCEEAGGCGKELTDIKDIYRCSDCDIAFHKHCIKKHFNETPR